MLRRAGRPLLLAACGLLLLIPSAQATRGALDPTFGTGGKVTTAIGPGDDVATALVLQPDGRLVAAGWSIIGGYTDFALARYKPDGTLDGSFNGTGKVTTAIGSFSAVATALAVQPDGKLVVAGAGSNGSNYDFALARYNPNGSLDTSFNGTGKVTTAIGSGDDDAFALAVQPDGKLVVAGESYAGSSYDFALARYNPNGSLDTSFNGTGKVTTQIGPGDDRAFALALQPDGRLVAAGTSGADFALARYNPNGSLDTSFNGSGLATTPVGQGSASAAALSLQPDGKLVAAGTSGDDFALARYNPDGSLDMSFGETGTLTTSIGPAYDEAGAVVLQPDGKIVAAGGSQHHSQLDFALARYNPDGSLDTRFNGTGKLTTLIGPGNDGANALVLQPDGRLVAAGSSDNRSGRQDFALARYRRHILCVVPKVDGKTLRAAERAIGRAQCSVGRVTRAFSATVKKGRVISQMPKPGKKLAAGSKVKLTVSKGKRT